LLAPQSVYYKAKILKFVLGRESSCKWFDLHKSLAAKLNIALLLVKQQLAAYNTRYGFITQ
jgi:hypothetical protein